MKPVTVFIDTRSENTLNIAEIKYSVKTLLSIAGLPVHFVSTAPDTGVDICYSRSKPEFPCVTHITALAIARDEITSPRGVVEEDGLVCFRFSGSDDGPILERRGKTVRFMNDIIFSSYYLLTGWDELFVRRDKHHHHSIEDSFYYKSHTIYKAAVNRYAKFIRGIFQDHEPIHPFPLGKKYAVCLTHDVDYPEMVRWIEILRYLLKNKGRSKLATIKDIVRGKNNFWKFAEWTRLEGVYGFKSAFYFCGYRGSVVKYFTKSPDPFYDINSDNFRQVFSILKNEGVEIGLHASYHSHLSEDAMRDEKVTLEKASGVQIIGNRHHYWHFNQDKPYETGIIHEKIGLRYDSSICFERHVGFRYGIASPFHLYNPESGGQLGILQIPTTFMDDHLFGYFDLNHHDSFEEIIDKLLDETLQAGGIFVADYHVNHLNETFFPGMKEPIQYLMKKVAEDSAGYVDTPANICDMWMKYEAKIEKASIDEIPLR